MRLGVDLALEDALGPIHGQLADFTAQLILGLGDRLTHLPAEAVVTLGCRFATAYRALTARAGLRAGETVAVIG